MQAARIEEVVGDVVRLKRKGSNLTGLCPFHQEKTPSFMVSPVKGIYKCFGCGKAGNAINFLMDSENATYPEALRRLAEKYHIEVEEDFDRDATEVKREAMERESLLIALKWAASLFSKTLLEEQEGKNIGLPYFRERGFRDDIIAKFELGYAPDRIDFTKTSAEKEGYKLDILKTAGILGTKDDQHFYDLYRGRVIFPIHNLSGKIIALAGRILDSTLKVSKYINSPESPVYIKNQVLYGAWFAKKSIRELDNCYLVEGYTDVITLHQYGIENVVASSGTSLTEGQISQIQRFTRNVTVLYDGDLAGIKASLRGIDMMLREGLQVWVVQFPDGQDPDSYCRKLGESAFKDFLIQHRKHFLAFKSALLLSEGMDPLSRANALKDIARSIAVIPDALERDLLIRDLIKQEKIADDVLLGEVSRQRKAWQRETTGKSFISENQATTSTPPTPSPIESDEAQEMDTLRVMLEFGEMPMDDTHSVNSFILEELENNEISFLHTDSIKMLEEIKKRLQQKLPVNSDFFIKNPDPSLSRLAANLTTQRHILSDHWVERYEVSIPTREIKYKDDVFSILNRLKIAKINVVLKEIDEAMQKETEMESQEKLLKTRQYYLEMRKLLSGSSGTAIVK